MARLILELGEKAQKYLKEHPEVIGKSGESSGLHENGVQPKKGAGDEEIVAGIVALGFSAKAAAAALNQVRTDSPNLDLSKTIREILIYLAK